MPFVTNTCHNPNRNLHFKNKSVIQNILYEYLISSPFIFASIIEEGAHFLPEKAQIMQHFIMGVIVFCPHFLHSNEFIMLSFGISSLLLLPQLGHFTIAVFGMSRTLH